MVDISQIVSDFLTRRDTPLYALVAERVYYDSAPRGWRNSNAMVLFDIINEEPPTPTANATWAYVIFYCYGGTDRQSDADAVYRALSDTLLEGGAKVASGELKQANFKGINAAAKEPETGWPVMSVSFRMFCTVADSHV